MNANTSHVVIYRHCSPQCDHGVHMLEECAECQELERPLGVWAAAIVAGLVCLPLWVLAFAAFWG